MEGVKIVKDVPKETILLSHLSHLSQIQRIAVAVSGGVDSLALALLLQENNADCVALTVDHGLRKEAAAEAEAVGKLMQKHKIPHVILTVKAKATGNTMEWAREQRYKLLVDYCKKHNISTLFVAHHQDDQIETFFLNLERGSGLKGLSGMREVSVLQGIQIVRPLLNIPKSALHAYLKKKKIKPVEDPTNRNAVYKRNRLRQMMEQVFPDNAELSNRITQAMAHLVQAEEFITEMAEKAMGEVMDANQIDAKAFAKLHPLLQYRVLLATLIKLSPKKKPPRSESVLALLNRMAQGEKAFTLHGMKGSLKKGTWFLAREISK